MTFVGNIIANIIFYVGYFFIGIGSRITNVGIFIHKTFKTKTGLHVMEFEAFEKDFQRKLKEAVNDYNTHKNGSFFVNGSGSDNAS